MVHSMYTMPIVVINMGGEMIFILSQRLKAQAVQEDKAKKVLQDVLKAMYAPVFIEELFKPQNMYSMTLTKGIFERLAHSSIMRLNKTSMDKLFDLMAMGFKRQIMGCLNPQDYVIITLNHLESLKLILNATNDDASKSSSCLMVIGLVQTAIDKLVAYYSALSIGQWWTVKQSISRFFQDKKVKVSLFLQNGSQKKDGTLVFPIHTKLPYHTESPGMVRYYDDNKVSNTRPFDTEIGENCSESRTILDLENTYGLDIYQQRTNKLQQSSINDNMNPSATAESKNSGGNHSATTASPSHTTSADTSTSSQSVDGTASSVTATDGSTVIISDELKPLVNSVAFYVSVEKLFQSMTLRDRFGNLQSPHSTHNIMTHHAISSGSSNTSTLADAKHTQHQQSQSPALMKLTEYNASPTTATLSSSGAKKELSLLADLLGIGIDNNNNNNNNNNNLSSPTSSDVKTAADSTSQKNNYAHQHGTFRLSLFPGDDDFFDDNNNNNQSSAKRGNAGGSSNNNGGEYNGIIEIDGTIENKSLQRYFDDLDLKEEKRKGSNNNNKNKNNSTNTNSADNNNDVDEDDLLALMDSVK